MGKLTRKELFNQVADLEAFGYNNVQIAQALSLSPGIITQIQQDDQYQQTLAPKITERLDKVRLRSEGWDAVEETAIARVIEELQTNPDPDYALRAAALANKASRHGHNGNAPIVAGKANTTVRLNLNFANAFSAQINGTANESDSNGNSDITIDMEDIEDVAEAVEGKRNGKGKEQVAPALSAPSDNDRPRKITNIMAPGEIEEFFLNENSVVGEHEKQSSPMSLFDSSQFKGFDDYDKFDTAEELEPSDSVQDG